MEVEISRLRDAEVVRDAKTFPLSLLRSLVKRLPVAGAIAEAVIDLREQRERERLEEAITQLSAKLEALEHGRLDGTRDLESLAAVFEEWTRRIQRQVRVEKRDRLVEFMVNAIEKPLPAENIDEALRFLQLIDELPDLEMLLLACIWTQQPSDVRALSDAVDVGQDDLVAAVNHLRAAGMLKPAPLGASWNDPMNHLLELTPRSQRFREYLKV
jgi:hypothetical protein